MKKTVESNLAVKKTKVEVSPIFDEDRFWGQRSKRIGKWKRERERGTKVGVRGVESGFVLGENVGSF